MTAAWLEARSIEGVTLALVTPEQEPLQLFGGQASDAARALLDEHGIAAHTGAYPAEARAGELLLVGGGIVLADRVVALPRLQGPRIGGLPQTAEGFIPVDPHGPESRTSTPPATSRGSRSSRAASPPSRPRLPLRRSPLTSASK
jgi:hypothetical protein